MFNFGLSPEESKMSKYWWGTRAIFTQRYIRQTRKVTTELDLLHDRQNFQGPQDEGTKKFMTWINTKGLPEVRVWASKVTTDSREMFNFEDEEYKIIATPNGSYGYMYIGAWSKKEVKNDFGDETETQ